ncbi:MAG: MFS transporter, partial [Pseudomonadota bacterium]
MQSNQRVAVQSPSESSLSIWLLWLAGLGAAMQFAKFSVFFQQLRGVYVDAGTSLGFLVSLISAMGVIFGVVAGLMVARFGYRRILLISLLAGGALSFLQAFILPFPVMLFSRVAEGAS